MSPTPTETSYSGVRKQMDAMKEGVSYAYDRDSGSWSIAGTVRERMVKEALFGTEAGGMPGLEIVEEAAADGLEGIDGSHKGTSI